MSDGNQGDIVLMQNATLLVSQSTPLTVQGCVRNDGNGILVVDMDDLTDYKDGQDVEIPVALEGGTCTGTFASVLVKFPDGSCRVAEQASSTRRSSSLIVTFRLTNTCGAIATASRAQWFGLI